MALELPSNAIWMRRGCEETQGARADAAGVEAVHDRA